MEAAVESEPAKLDANQLITFSFVVLPPSRLGFEQELW